MAPPHPILHLKLPTIRAGRKTLLSTGTGTSMRKTLPPAGTFFWSASRCCSLHMRRYALQAALVSLMQYCRSAALASLERSYCAARILDCVTDLRCHQLAGWLAGCCLRSPTCWFAGYSVWLCCYSAGTWRRMLSCWHSGTRTRCCADTSARSGTSQRTGCGSPRWPG